MNRKTAILKVQSEIIRAASDLLWRNDFHMLLMPIISEKPNHTKDDQHVAQLNLSGKRYNVATTNTLEKVEAMKYFRRVFIITRVVRLEEADPQAEGRHLCEFSTIDVEVAGIDYLALLELGEKLICYIIASVCERCADELGYLGRVVESPKAPFERITHHKLVHALKERGLEADPTKDIPFSSELEFSKNRSAPAWILDYPNGARGFLDRVNPMMPEYLMDFDLILPEGYCELMSGGERESTREGVTRQISRLGFDPSQYEGFLKLYDDGNLPPSGGFGFGIERLTRYLCGLKHISEATISPKLPGLSRSS